VQKGSADSGARDVAFKLLQGGSRGPRRGRLGIGSLEIPTPVFMPVGTRASVKTLGSEDLEEIGARLILGNTYHLHLRPGADLIRRRGGLRRFMSWSGGILTDSGGFQVHSLAALRKIRPEGIEFRSHLDGSSHFFTPEGVLDIQADLGSDISMVLDVCTTPPTEERRAREDMELTVGWAERSISRRRQMEHEGTWAGALFGIVQGSTFPHLRSRCARALAGLGFDGYALGGFSVGESAEARYPAMDAALGALPKASPRYLMGMGTPADILDAVGRGVDMFDCVLPTRNARKGTVYTWGGKLVVKKRIYAEDDSPLDPECRCPTCRRYSRAYLRHLFRVHEMLAGRLATIHTLAFYLELMGEIRRAVDEGRFAEFAARTRERFAGEPG